MMEIKADREYLGKDVFFDGQRVGWMSLGDMREAPQDRRPRTMLEMDRGTMYHENYDAAIKYLETMYQTYKTEVTP